MPCDSGLNVDPALHLAKESPVLALHHKIICLLLVLATAGYASFADIMECIFTLDPLRFEYEFNDYISEDTWLIITITIAAIYGLSTILCEGKGVYDLASHYFLDRNKKAAFPHPGEPPEIVPLPVNQEAVELSNSYFIWFFPRFVSLVSSAADSSETTMGLVKEGANLTKTIAISMLSFLGSISFYGPITVEALEELFLGKNAPKLEANQTPSVLSKIIGYPVALFSALQDTLECGASLFKNFRVTGTTHQWAMVAASSLAGISNLCLDGKKGVEIIDAFFTHLRAHYAWLPPVLTNRTLPAPSELYQLGYESSTLVLAGYAASFIAFADKELTIALSESILATLGVKVPLLPHILGWCVVLRDFVIQTKTLHMLERMILKAVYHGWENMKQMCATNESAPTPLSDQESDSEMEEGEETELLRTYRFSEPSERQEKNRFHRFFKSKTTTHSQQEYGEPTRSWSCRVM